MSLSHCLSIFSLGNTFCIVQNIMYIYIHVGMYEYRCVHNCARMRGCVHVCVVCVCVCVYVRVCAHVHVRVVYVT